MHQGDVRQPLAKMRLGRNRRIVEPLIRHRRRHHRQADGHRKRQHQPQIAAPDQGKRLPDEQHALWRQTAGRKKTTHHEKYLHRHAGIIDQPLRQIRELHRQRSRQWPVKRQVMHQHQLRRERPQGVDQRHAGGGRGIQEANQRGEAHILIAFAAPHKMIFNPSPQCDTTLRQSGI